MNPFALSSVNVDDVNNKYMEDLYQEIQKDLGIYTFSGTEDFSEYVDSLTHGLKYIAKKIQTLTTRVLFSLRNVIEKTFLRYSAIIVRWDSRLKNKLDKIDTEQFEQHVTTMVSKQNLYKRIDALLKVHHVLDNIELVCDARVNLDSEDWRTREIMTAYNALDSIGFNAHRFNLIKTISAKYDLISKEKNKLISLDYRVSDLPDIISKVTTLANYANQSSVDQLTKRFLAYSDKLTKYEDDLSKLMESDSIDQLEFKEKKHEIDIKLARLWWVSHFIKASYTVAEDIMISVLKLCKIAEKYQIQD